MHDYRELFVLLVRRELKARYKDSTLGFLWTLIRPRGLSASATMAGSVAGSTVGCSMFMVVPTSSRSRG